MFYDHLYIFHIRRDTIHSHRNARNVVNKIYCCTVRLQCTPVVGDFSYAVFWFPVYRWGRPRGTQSAVSIKANTYLESAKAEEHPSGIFIAQKYRLLKTLIFSSSFLTRKNGTFGVASS